jgi:hypothetical protein
MSNGTIATARSAAATLPQTLDPEHRERIVLVDGASGWVQRTLGALSSRDDAVALVASPCPEDASALAPLAARIVLDTTWGHSPALSTAATQLRGQDCPLLEALCETEELPHRRLGEVLDVLDRLIGIAELRIVLSDDDRLIASGTGTDGRRLRVTTVRTARGTEGLRIRSIGPDSVLDLHLADDATAHPARLTVADLAERRELRVPWETPSRSAWRHAVDLLDSPDDPNSAGSPDTGHDAPTDIERLLRISRLLERASPSVPA